MTKIYFVDIHRVILEMSREKLFWHGESKRHKPIESQMRNRNPKPSVTFLASFLVSFVYEEIRWGLREEGQGEQLDQGRNSTGGHQHGPQGTTAQQLPGGDKTHVCRIKVHCTGFWEEKGVDGEAEEEAKGRGGPGMNWVVNHLYYTFVLQFALWLFPVTKRKRQWSLQIHVAS